MLDYLKRIIEEEKPEDRRRRMIPAAMYGAIVATIYVWSFSLVNIYSFPNLPLGVDWLYVIQTWIGLTVAFTAFGAIAAWFTEEYAGIVGGALIFTALMALWFLVAARSTSSTVTAQSIITTLPLIGVNMLAAWAARWAARHHIAITNEKNTSAQRKQWIQHIGIIVLIGLVPGLFGRMDRPAERTLGQLHELLQAAPTDPSIRTRLPVRQVPALEDHFGVPYTIYARQSELAVGVMQAVVRFEDGFVMTCQLPIATEIQFISTCSEGKTYSPGP